MELTRRFFVEQTRNMILIPSDWKPIGHKVGPFGPDEIEVRENPAKGLSARQWEVRFAARPDEVSVAKPVSTRTCNLYVGDDIKGAIAHVLQALTPNDFDKDRGSLPANFSF